MKNDSYTIRLCRKEDEPQVEALFHDTVHHIAAKDYDLKQLDAWAPQGVKLTKHFENNSMYVAEKDGIIVGFADLTQEGFVDALYVHKDFQRKGIAALLLKTLEDVAKNCAFTKLTTEASLTALPFFLAQGFLVQEKRNKERRGAFFTTFLMKKSLC